MDSSPQLHTFHAQKLTAIINITHTLLHSLALFFIFHYRISFLYNYFTHNNPTKLTPITPFILLFISELILSFVWLHEQAFRWRPVIRKPLLERLPEVEEELPAVDVFICTADPEKEPTFDVMNTVVSAMALDYPAEKLSVYLSDDGGFSGSLRGMKEAWVFGTWWVPFCRTFGVKPSCPKAYFDAVEEGKNECHSSKEFFEQRKIVKEKYEEFKEHVLSFQVDQDSNKDDASMTSARDHPPVIEIINGGSINVGRTINPKKGHLPLLVYVAREKRPSHPHHYKAGALNVLLRVSGMISNSPIILVLDCDMYCNDTLSARQAMCFHLDPSISSSLAFVQFPQKFHNVCNGDIYDSKIRSVWDIYWPGMNGLKGPILSGTNFYIKRKALYGDSPKQDINLMKSRDRFDVSNEFLKSLGQIYNTKTNTMSNTIMSPQLVQEAKLLASCTYEKDTKWGEKVGFMYDSVLEDVLTGYTLHGKGWTSVFYDPPNPQFLGSATTNLNDTMIQTTRWYAGLMQIVISKYCPFIYGPKMKMPVLQCMCYVYITVFPLNFIAAWCLAFIPQICLLHGCSLYPNVKDLAFVAFAYAFLSANLKHLCEVVTTSGHTGTWLAEQRIWMFRSLSSNFYALLQALFGQVLFLPTNKVYDELQSKLYNSDKYDFRTSNMFLVPVIVAVIVNVVAVFSGIWRVVSSQSDWGEVLGAAFLAVFVVVMGFPVIEGVVVREDSGRVPIRATLVSALFCVCLLALGPCILLH